MRESVKIPVIILVCFQAVYSGILDNSFGWCNTNDRNSYDGYIAFNIKTHSCMECSGKSTVVERERVKALKCCTDGSLKGKCLPDEIQCKDGGYFEDCHRCDGKKNCEDGTDEIDCKPDGLFACMNEAIQNNIEQRISPSKLCDGVKNCVSGLDESNCTYFGGKCNGFLCTTIQQCIDLTKACDGSKDCLDGSDETMCPELMKTDVFECNGTGVKEGFPVDDICDGHKDCQGGEDERNCFAWNDWSVWSACKCPTDQVPVVTRTRVCGTLRPNVKSYGQCKGDSSESRNITCNCENTTGKPNKQGSTNISIILVIIITMAVTIMGIIFMLKTIMRKKRAWLSYSQAAISFGNPTSETLINQATVDTNADEHITLSDIVPERMLPPTPGLPLSPLQHTYSSIKFGSQLSFHSNEENTNSSILVPREDDSYQQTVRNPLYHSHTNVNHQLQAVYNRLSVSNTTSPFKSFGSEGPDTPSAVSEMEFTDVFDDDDDDNGMNLMAQIEIAQMGNLIEVSDIKIQ